MSFKAHLIIVSVIIITVYIAWQMMNAATVKDPVVQAPPPVELQTISIVHASWGLNCRNLNRLPYETNVEESNSKLHQDNVLVKVSELCNGKAQCIIPITSEALGGNPSSQCADKVLEIEYRCFSYDRPWKERAVAGAISIDCNKSASGGTH